MRLTRVASKRGATLGAVIAIALVLGVVGVVLAQNPPAQQAPAGVVFAGDAAMVLNYIKTDKAADFEAAMAKVKEALQKSQNPERKQQAAGWKIFKSPDPAGEGQTLFVFVIDPVVKGANYSVSTILGEGFPTEARDIFQKYADAYGKGQVRVNLNQVLAMGQ
jgi:hypothetical protein